ncbi:Uncharacterised protein [uncultured archaeon]|nr:Uncharacterised protein [uncultured archaeon]
MFGSKSVNTDGSETLHFLFNGDTATGARKLVKLLRSRGYGHCRVRKTVLEVCGQGKQPMDIALTVASLAFFAFEKDVSYKPVKAAGGMREFLVELH